MEQVAIIGLGLRFPGAKDPESFWRLLHQGVDAITDIPPERWDLDELYDPKPSTPGKMITRHGGFLDRVDLFDPSFFGISPREAASIDPQQRLILEVAWEALENAGISPDTLSGSQTGVFIGIGNHDYSRLQSQDLTRLNAYDGPGASLSITANRLSYTLNLRGPSLAVETSCSSSLVAVHLACQSLETRESNLCLVGGVSVILSPESNIIFSHAQMMAADGRCKTFDASADGYVRGEGCGTIVLKRLAEAIRDEDNILAVIKGSAVNQDGLSNGLTAPNGLAQQAVIRKALDNAGVAPARISYVEAHGTGTSLGDPIEIKSLQAVLIEGRQPTQTCHIGSVKTNIGHLEPASGMAGLIKTILSLQHRQIPPHLHLDRLNPYIKIENTPFAIPTTLQKWEVDDETRLAGVSAFGFGGTNAHVILEEAPAPVVGSNNNLERAEHLLTLSAKSAQALQDLAQSYETKIQSHPEVSIGDLCFTTNTGRSHFNHRLAIVANSTAQLCERLSAVVAGKDTTEFVSGQITSRKSPQIAFLCTGQGAQYAQMGKQLYDTQPVFRTTIDECARLLTGQIEHPLVELLYGSHTDRLNHTAYSQPALFALEYALVKLWQSWGITPDLVMGHSVGEYVAACIAGVFSLADGLKLISQRGRLMQALPAEGQMVAVRTDQATVNRAISSAGVPQVAIAAVNGAQSLVISGRREQVDAVVALLITAGIKTTPLNVSHAFHSDLMEPMLAEFERIASEVTYHPSRLPLISNVTGQLADGRISTPGYWVGHIRSAVQFSTSMETLQARGEFIGVEIGPKPILLGMGRDCLPPDVGIWLPSLRPGVEDSQQMLQSLAQLYVSGVSVDWLGFHRDFGHRKVVLPTYPFQRLRFWLPDLDHLYKKRALSRSKILHPLLGQKLHLQLHLAGLEQQHRFESQISAAQPEYLSHHQVFDRAILPATAYLEIALAAGFNLFKSQQIVVEDVVFQQGLMLSATEPSTVQTKIAPLAAGSQRFEIFTLQQDRQAEQSWTLHASGNIRTANAEIAPPPIDIANYLAECDPIDVAEYYQTARERGINYGVSFQGIQALWSGIDRAIGRIQLSSELIAGAVAYQLHPALLDAALQVMGAAIGETERDRTYLPVQVERLSVYRRPDDQVWAIAELDRLEGNSSESLSAKITLVDNDGAVIAIVAGLRIKSATIHSLVRTQPASLPPDWFYEVQWRTQSRFGRSLPPSYLLPPAEVVSKLAAPIATLVTQQADLHRYSEMLDQLEELSGEYIVQALIEMGWPYQTGADFGTETAAQRLGVVPNQRRLFERLLQVLAELDILDFDRQQWHVKAPLAAVNPAHKVEQLSRQYPDNPAEITLLQRCATQLSSILRGAIDPVEIVFPQGDLTAVTQLYQESPAAKVMNTLVQQTISTAVAKLPAARAVRILEIGAGTGGTTSYILPHLDPDRTEYVVTDIGAFFNSKAQAKFQDYPFVRYEILDIEVDPTTQGFDAHQYDVVVAANVLHATTSMSQTLANVHKLLAPGGILVLLESTTRQRWLDLIFGLLDGWWKFSDRDLRPDYPLLSTSQWQKLLTDQGFPQVSMLPPTAETPASLSRQAVIVAQTESKLAASALPAPRGWLILADPQGVARQLAAQLRNQGDVCTLVFAGTKCHQIAPDEWEINPHQFPDFEQLMTHMASQSPTLHGVVQCWSLETELDPGLTVDRLAALAQLGCGTTLSLVQSLVSAQLSAPPRLWLVTQGAQPVPTSSPTIQGVAQSSLWGMGKVIGLEHPELKCVRIDLDPHDSAIHQGQSLWSEIWSEDKEDQVALRADSRYVARLKQSSHPQQSTEQRLKVPSQPFRLTTTGGGMLENLILEPTARKPPAPGEVEIRVRATGLNFLDAIAALGLLPAQVDGVSQQHLLALDSFGGECAGEIVAIGSGVTGLQIGQSVIALAAGSFSQYVTVSDAFVVPKPADLSFEAAASIPVNFLTADYALHQIAKITPGDRVLIHAAAGGTGMAAVRIAQLAGAEVFATASPPKWAALRAMGVKHIMNSRNLDFAGTVMELTQGQGVDIVLNSLTSGEFIPKSLSAVAPHGRFVEIAKRGVWTSTQMAAARPDVAYSVVDLVQTSRQQPALIQSMLQELVVKFDKNLLQPPQLTIFGIESVISAFRDMQQAKHIGKIVVAQTDATTDSTSQLPLKLSGDSTYLITGGLGGLGLIVARWMVERGAKHLVLLGRSQPSDAAQRQLVELAAAGANIIVKQADVAVHQSMAQVLTEIDGELPPLAGIIHAVGVLEDGILQQQSWARFAKVMNPKVLGAWNLHQLTKDRPLDFFVLFSSFASLLGSPAQANHSAANAFLDGLAYYRQAMGLPGSSINWGTISQVGEAAERGADITMQQKGIGAITPDRFLAALELLMQGSRAEVGVVPIDWSTLLAGGVRSPFWADWQENSPTSTSSSSSASSPEFLQQLQSAIPSDQRDLLITYLRRQVAQVLRIADPRAINLDVGFFDLGMDSLTSVELRNCLQTSLGCAMPSTVAFDYPTVRSLADYLVQQVLTDVADQSNGTGAQVANIEIERQTQQAQLVAKTQELSEDQLAELINQKLNLLIHE
jgi:acyl transferase domain-containing protein/acyl carrier protein